MILGGSPDDAKSHRDFQEAFGLPFTLLVDESLGNARTTFVIDAEGRIARVFEKVKPEGHAAEVAAALEAMR